MPTAPIATRATRATGPAVEAGTARSALDSARHGPLGRTFFLLTDEDPAGFQAHERAWLAAWSPRDLQEREAAHAAIGAMWREERADRLEVVVLNDLFAAARIADAAEREAAKATAFKALGTLLRYRARVERERRQAMAALEALHQRRPARLPSHGRDKTAAPMLPSEPEPAAGAATAAVPSDPEPRALNRHQRRVLAAIERKALRWAA